MTQPTGKRRTGPRRPPRVTGLPLRLAGLRPFRALLNCRPFRPRPQRHCDWRLRAECHARAGQLRPTTGEKPGTAVPASPVRVGGCGPCQGEGRRRCPPCFWPARRRPVGPDRHPADSPPDRSLTVRTAKSGTCPPRVATVPDRPPAMPGISQYRPVNLTGKLRSPGK
jgi:hypothetical protein